MLDRNAFALLASSFLAAACSDSTATQSANTTADPAPPVAAASNATSPPASADSKALAQELAELRRLVAESKARKGASPVDALGHEIAELRTQLDALRERRDTREDGFSSVGSTSGSASGWTAGWETVVEEKPMKNMSTRPASTPAERSIQINDAPVDPQKLTRFEQLHGVQLPNGSYWYDRQSGAFGVFGGPCTGYARAGVDVAGPMPANCSGGGTGVFVNGRDLHRLEVMLLSQVTTVYRGRYTLDAQGNVGIEGGPFLYNVFQVGQQMMAAQQRGGGNGGQKSWSRSGIFGHTGGDGETFYFLDGNSSYISGQ